jgi:hypothetical protein
MWHPGGVLSLAEALAAIPEPPGVTLYRCPPGPECRPGGLTVEVAGVAGTAGPEGRGEERAMPVPVGLDRAHDLSWRGPEVYVWPEAGGRLGVLRWTVIALGFIEQEARDAFEATCIAIDSGKRLPQRGRSRQGMMRT